MKICLIIVLAFMASACSTPRAKPVNCDGHLSPINAQPATASTPVALNASDPQTDGVM